MILRFATVTNGELAYRSYKDLEAKVGLPLVQLAEKNRGVRVDYKDLQSRPLRILNSPMWSGQVENGRAYSPFTYQRGASGAVAHADRPPAFLSRPSRLHRIRRAPAHLQTQTADEGVWRSEVYAGPGQEPDAELHDAARQVEDPLHLQRQPAHDDAVARRRTALDQRTGCRPARAGGQRLGGDCTTTTAWSSLAPPSAPAFRAGICIQYHAPERTYSVPKSPLRKGKRAGGHNSLTRIRMKPNLMVGGYGQFTYHFNYWGPTGVNRDTHILVRKLPDLEW